MWIDVQWYCYAVAAMILMDVLTGFIASLKEGTTSSTVMREGLYHKGSEVLIVVLAFLIEVFLVHVPELPFDVPLVKPCCVFLVVMEIVSILENIVKINPELKDTKIFDLLSPKEE